MFLPEKFSILPPRFVVPAIMNPAGRWFAVEQIAANCLFAFLRISQRWKFCGKDFDTSLFKIMDGVKVWI